MKSPDPALPRILLRSTPRRAPSRQRDETEELGFMNRPRDRGENDEAGRPGHTATSGAIRPGASLRAIPVRRGEAREADDCRDRGRSRPRAVPVAANQHVGVRLRYEEADLRHRVRDAGASGTLAGNSGGSLAAVLRLGSRPSRRVDGLLRWIGAGRHGYLHAHTIAWM